MVVLDTSCFEFAARPAFINNKEEYKERYQNKTQRIMKRRTA